MEFLKFLGKNAKRSFYARDFRNNYRFRPDVNPPRIKFEGYVNFVLNRDIQELFGLENHTFKTNISSLVRRAKLPNVTFKNIVKNQYNKKKIVSTGVEYAPIEITVFDTLNNEWLQILMRYFSYLYMNPRNKNFANDRDVQMNTDSTLENSPGFGFKNANFQSGEAGFNLQKTKQFFERIDIIMYHGGKGVQYSMTGPIINSFDFGEIDYSSNEFVEFNIVCDYENFTTFDVANFDLSGVDLDRFENVLGLNFASDEVMSKPLGIIDDGMKMEFLGEKDHAGFGSRGRTTQPQQAPAQGGDVTKEKPDTCGPETPLPNGVQGTAPTLGTYDAIDLPLSQNPNETPGKTLLSTAILAKLTGNDVGDAVKNYALTVVERELLKKTSNVASAPTRGSE